MEGSDLYQKFTAIGKIIDDAPYQVDMGDGFKPFRRNINYWNLVDASAHLIIGVHLSGRDRDALQELAASQNLWERRIAIVPTWYFIRKSDLEWTFKIAKLLQEIHTIQFIKLLVGYSLKPTKKMMTD